MAVTIEQVLSDAKKLVLCLRASDVMAENVLTDTQCVHRKIEAMKQYQDQVEDLNEIASQRPHTALVADIQHENRHLRDLQQENRELRAALEENQNALELIMTKYRQQVSQLINSTRIDLNSVIRKKFPCPLYESTDKLYEVLTIMDKASEMDEKRISEEQELITRLITENKGLREMLAISCKYGSLNQSTPKRTTESSNSVDAVQSNIRTT